MSDLISRQAAIEAIKKYDFKSPEYARYYLMRLKNAIKADLVDDVNAIPSAEVEPVTRCKDCIYYRQEIDMCDEPYSTAHNVVREDDYCSRAERKPIPASTENGQEQRRGEDDSLKIQSR